LIEIGTTVFAIVKLETTATDGLAQLLAGKELLVKNGHHQLGGAHRHRVAHRQHHLHAGLHQATAQTGFSHAHLLARLTGIENRDRRLVSEQQRRQLSGFHRIGLANSVALQK